jgi:hypothetical protein
MRIDNSKPMRQNTWVGIGLLVLIVAGAWWWSTRAPADSPEAQLAARRTVETFGQQLKMVPLLAEPSVRNDAFDTYYKPYVSSRLLDRWKSDSSVAPGRLTSSPAPDRIEVYEVVRNGGAYLVRGNLIETSSSGPAQAYLVVARVEHQGGAWVLTDFQGGPER